MTAKTAEVTTPVTKPAKPAAYVKGSHAARVRAEHDERRTELLARDEILAGEIERREAERHDINEALRLMSEPAPAAHANVVSINAPAAAE